MSISVTSPRSVSTRRQLFSACSTSRWRFANLSDSCSYFHSQNPYSKTPFYQKIVLEFRNWMLALHIKLGQVLWQIAALNRSRHLRNSTVKYKFFSRRCPWRRHNCFGSLISRETDRPRWEPVRGLTIPTHQPRIPFTLLVFTLLYFYFVG